MWTTITNTIDLRATPFNLKAEEISWVKETIEGMSSDDKIEQLFCPLLYSNDPGYLHYMSGSHQFGGVMFRPGEAGEVKSAVGLVQKNSKIPLLISANLEDGGSGVSFEGTYIGRQMLVGATNNPKRAYQLGKVCGIEGAELGVNWTFSPIIDLDLNFHNPITNVRCYGSEPELVEAMGKAYMKGLEESKMAATIKHFPGDGVDGRDQHLVTSVNDLTLEDWEATFGYVYRSLIEEGAKSVMVGHIAMPAMEAFMDGKTCEEVIPASISKNIIDGYLRKELGFNGLITTDATPMVGMMAVSRREEAVPLSIENGCDMFLFTRDIEEDIAYMKQGYKTGVLSERRLNEAVTRILALKASIGIITDEPETKTLAAVDYEMHQVWAKEIADEGITLVKEEKGVLPLSSRKTPRVLLEILGDFASNERVSKQFESLLKKEGFEVTKYVPETLETIFENTSVAQFKESYDLVLYVANIENASNKTVSRINWHTLFGSGNNLPWFAKEVPTLFVSVGNPYHLYDVPMIQTYINGYCHAPTVIDAVVEKLMGRSEFKGINPVDPFCGCWDTSK